MEIEVDGVEISLEEWSDDSWTPPQGFRAQAKRHQALKQQAQMNDAQVSKAPKTPPTPRPPPELKRHPLPRLPSHTYHIVGRPKTPIDLTRTSPGDLQRALLKAASLCDLDPAKRDQLRIHPRNNTSPLVWQPPTEQSRTNASHQSSSEKTGRLSYTCTPRHQTTRYEAFLSTPTRSPPMMRR
ncbi:hypothetical protein HPB51_000938 [Rhipicephalus microplus]|uniref:Uncharacterized protein n=1 Tax=Rhipicephalus microplus TaxID=6941 RepID=A0A9J6DL14_RHIMP|nr:hypothetical protein HPB51_000938 [Rhipicephalus microplus]